MFCSECGKQLGEGALFCSECGTKVAQVSQPEEAPEQEAPRTEEAPKQKAAQKLQKEEKKAQKKKGKGRIVAAALVVLGLAGGAAGVAWHLYGDEWLTQKNLEQARTNLSIGNYEEATVCFHAVLEHDETLTEAYTSLADIHVLRGEYEAAIKVIKEGMEKAPEGALEELTKKLDLIYEIQIEDYVEQEAYEKAVEALEQSNASPEALKERKTQLYAAMVEKLLENNEYEEGLKLLDKALEETGNAVFEEQKAEVFQQQFDDLMAQEQLEEAKKVLEEGITLTDAPKLYETRLQLYHQLVEDYLPNGDYEGALQAAEEAFGVTKDASFLDKKVEIYRKQTDSILTQQGVEAAVTLLNEAIEKTEDDGLAEYRDTLIEHAKVVSLVRENGQGREEVSYDDAGNEVACITSDASGQKLFVTQSVYDDAGNRVEYVCEDGDGNTIYRNTVAYNANNKPTENYIKDTQEQMEYTSFYAYDEQGRLVEILAKDADGNQVFREEYSFFMSDGKSCRKQNGYNAEDVLEYTLLTDKEDNILEYVFYNEEGSVDYREEYTRDKKGNVIEYAFYDANGQKQNADKHGYTYHANGEVSEYTEYGEKGEILLTEVYDEEGRPVEKKRYDETGILIYSEKMSYDQQGNVLSEAYEDLLLEESYYYQYVYNEQGDRVEMTYTDVQGNTQLQKTAYTYDSMNRILKMETCDSLGAVIYSREAEYDAFGNVIYEIEVTDESSDVATYHYVYKYVE